MTPRWLYPLVNVSANRSAARTAVPVGLAAELVGVDGAVEGGLRPFRGFRRYHTLTGSLGNTSNQAEAGVFGVTIRIGDTEYGRGFIYRIKSTTSNNCRYFFEWRLNQETSWRGPVDLVGSKSNGDKQMDVAVVGKTAYVGVAGSRPFGIRIDKAGAVYTVAVTTDTGPGLAPKFSTPALNSISAKAKHSTPTVAHADQLAVFTQMTPPADEDADARVIFVGLSELEGVDSGSGPADTENPYLVEHNTTTAPDYADPITGPSDLFNYDGDPMWASPPQEDPAAFGDLILGYPAAPEPPAYSFPSPRGEFNGALWAGKTKETDPQAITIKSLENKQVFAYQLYDERTGRRSALSARVGVIPGVASAASFNSFKQPGEVGQGWYYASEPVTFPFFQIIYNSDLYTHAILYRGISQSPLSPEQTLLSLEAVLDLEDYQVDTQPASPWKVAGYFVQLAEDVLTLQPTWLGGTEYFEDMPTAGALYSYEITMLFGSIGKLDKGISGLGVFRWSDLQEPSVELVKPSSKYPLQEPDEEVLRFCKLGPNVLALTGRSTYLVRRETLTIKAFPLHEGFGIANSRAACTVASTVYFCTDQGLKAIDSDFTLTDITAVNYIIVEEWKGQLSQIKMAFDETVGIIFIHNPVLEKTILLWRNTSKVTELHDMVFGSVCEASVLYGTRYRRQAVFAQTAIEPAFSNTVVVHLYVVDQEETKAKLTLLEPTDDVVLTVAANATGPDTGVVSGANIYVTGNYGTRIVGMYAYVLDGPLAGTKRKIRGPVPGQPTLLAFTEAWPVMAVGTKLGISPVYFRWVGHQAGITDELGNPVAQPDMFKLRSCDQVGAAITDLGGGQAGTANAKWRGLLYRGTGAEPISKAFPKDRTGADAQSLVEGPSKINAPFEAPYGRAGSALFPGIEVFTPDLDFRLLAALASGTIRTADREAMP